MSTAVIGSEKDRSSASSEERRVFTKRTVAGVMTRDPVTVSPGEQIHTAAGRLARYEISGAPVVDEGRLVGVVSEADLVGAAFPPAAIERPGSPAATVLGLFLRGRAAGLPEDATVASVMTEDVVSTAPSASLLEAAAVMQRRGLKRLPVVDYAGHLVGIVSRSDLVAAIARTEEELLDDVLDAIALAGEESVEDVEVEIRQGTATLSGTADRRSTKDVALKLAARVPGVLEVVDRLDFESDDTKDVPRQKDPWAIGPLVKAR